MSLLTPPHLSHPAVLEQMPGGYVALNRDWQCTYVNEAAAGSLGCAPQELLGRPMWSVFPELPAAMRAHLQLAMDRGQEVHLSVQYEPLGTWLRLSVYPTTEGVSIYTHDDTVRRRYEALREQLHILKTALDAAGSVREVALAILNVAVPGVGAAGGVLALRDGDGRALKMVHSEGYREEQTAPWQRIPLSLRVPLTDAYLRARPLFLTGAQARAVYPDLPGGADVHGLTCLPLMAGQDCAGVLGFSYARDRLPDADEQVYLEALATHTAQAVFRAQQEKRQREELALQHLLLRSTGTLLWSADANLWFNDLNVAWLEFTGLSAGPPDVAWSLDLVHPDDREDVLAQARTGVTSGRPFTLRGRARRHDGQYCDLESQVEPVRDESGTLSGWVGVMQDVTERQRTRRFEAARRRMLDHLTGVWDHAALLCALCGETRALTGAARVTLWQRLPGAPEWRVLASDAAPDTSLPAGSLRDDPFWNAAPFPDNAPPDELTALDPGGLRLLHPLPLPEVPETDIAGAFGLLYDLPCPLEPEVRRMMGDLSRTLRTSLQRALVVRDLAGREEKYRMIVEALHESVLIVDGTGHFRTMNGSARRLLRLPGTDDQATELGLEGWQYFTAHGQPLPPDEYPVHRSLRGEQIRNLLLDARHASGAQAWWRMNAGPFPPLPDGIPRAVVSLSDVTAQTRLQQQLEFRAAHDDLTGLLNRRAFLSHIDSAALHAEATGEHLAVLQIGLDRFKVLTDTLGQHLGDEVLRVTARRVQQVLQGQGVAASLHGDQFGLAAPVRAPVQAAHLAQTLRRELNEPIHAYGHEVSVTVSIGVTVAPADGRDGQTLLRNADLTMQRAKRHGRNAALPYEARLGRETARQQLLERELSRAIRRTELSLTYQPLVNLRTGELEGAEALSRWTSPHLGPVSPAEFIPIAESTGQITELGTWVLRHAAQQAAAWNVTCHASLHVSVNVSALQFTQPAFADTVRDALTRAGLPPAQLDLELTESAVMHDVHRSRAMLEELRALGVRISLDDFGTGHSSLGILDALPFDRIKLDREFTWGLDGNPRRQRVAGHMIALARTLDLDVVAEGVETAAQRALLLDLGCDTGQGYLFAPPLTPDAFHAQFLQPD